MRTSMAVSFTLMLILILAAFQTPLWIWFLFTQKYDHQQRLMDKVITSAGFLTEASRAAMASGRTSALQNMAEHAIGDRDIISVRVFDDSGRVLVNVFSSVEERKDSANPLYIKWKDLYSTPIRDNGVELGRIEVVYSGEAANEAMFRLLTIPSIAQAIVFVFIVLSVYHFVRRRIGGPVEKLAGSIKAVTSGDLSVKIPETGDVDLAEIADGLRYLVNRMLVNRSRLDAMMQSVTDTLLALEATFAATIERVKRQSAATDQIATSIKSADASQGSIHKSTEGLLSKAGENVASLLEIKACEAEIDSSMERLLHATDSSYSVIAEMSQTSKVMSGNSLRVLASVENTSASVEEIIASVRDVESTARESSRIAEVVRTRAAHDGIAIVDKAIKSMELITNRVKYSLEIVSRLEARSKDIERILSVIKEVTEQTNMLSINASILAEQAGEYGKGFAVVADEMRALSNRTEGYTKEIAGIIGTIRQEIKDVVSANEKGMSMVKEGRGTVYQVGETMSDILESAHNSANMTKMIERATQDQVLALRHIESSVIEVNTLALDMNRAMEEMTKSSTYMQERVGEVKDVAEITKKGTNELSIGMRMISMNLDDSRVGLDSINEAIVEQQRVGKGIQNEVETIRNSVVWIVSDMESVRSTLSELERNLDILRDEMDAFRKD